MRRMKRSLSTTKLFYFQIDIEMKRIKSKEITTLKKMREEQEEEKKGILLSWFCVCVGTFDNKIVDMEGRSLASFK